MKMNKSEIDKIPIIDLFKPKTGFITTTFMDENNKPNKIILKNFICSLDKFGIKHAIVDLLLVYIGEGKRNKEDYIITDVKSEGNQECINSKTYRLKRKIQDIIESGKITDINEFFEVELNENILFQDSIKHKTTYGKGYIYSIKYIALREINENNDAIKAYESIDNIFLEALNGK